LSERHENIPFDAGLRYHGGRHGAGTDTVQADELMEVGLPPEQAHLATVQADGDAGLVHRLTPPSPGHPWRRLEV